MCPFHIGSGHMALGQALCKGCTQIDMQAIPTGVPLHPACLLHLAGNASSPQTGPDLAALCQAALCKDRTQIDMWGIFIGVPLHPIRHACSIASACAFSLLRAFHCKPATDRAWSDGHVTGPARSLRQTGTPAASQWLCIRLFAPGRRSCCPRPPWQLPGLSAIAHAISYAEHDLSLRGGHREVTSLVLPAPQTPYLWQAIQQA